MAAVSESTPQGACSPGYNRQGEGFPVQGDAIVPIIRGTLPSLELDPIFGTWHPHRITSSVELAPLASTSHQGLWAGVVGKEKDSGSACIMPPLLQATFIVGGGGRMGGRHEPPFLETN